MKDTGLGFHETADLHELMTFKNVCAVKSTTMAGLASDPALRDLLKEDAQAATRAVKDISSLLEPAAGERKGGLS
ncbi:MAG: hypothetical protein ACM3X4_12665 [Ignavibacteriales bacterium]